MQTVLYESTSERIDWFLRGLRSAVHHARSAGVVSSVLLAVGDCSTRPVIAAEDVPTLQKVADTDGIDVLSYRFFGDNLGHAGGQNRLFTECEEDLVLFLNPDAFTAPTLLVELLRPLSDPMVGIVEARQLPLEHPKAADPKTGETSWASFSCACVRANVVRAIGGFDASSFFLYCDDVDFSWRARLAGYAIRHQPAARVFHDKRLTPEGKVAANDAERYYAAEAMLLMLWKYSRPDLVERCLADFQASGSRFHEQAAGAFVERKQRGILPAQIDPEGRVAEFVDGDFGTRRFSYDD